MNETDNNIIKALECCILKENCAEKSCELCPYEINYECRETMFQDAINLIKYLKNENEILEAKHNCLAHLSIKSDNLINRQKAEIARLQTDVAPIRHGHWISQFVSKRGLSKHFVCSECAEWAFTAHKVKMIKYDYCPHCGARMDDNEVE